MSQECHALQVSIEPMFTTRTLLYSLDAQTPFYQFSKLDHSCVLRQMQLHKYQHDWDTDCEEYEFVSMGKEYDVQISTSNHRSFAMTLVHSSSIPQRFYVSKQIETTPLEFHPQDNSPLSFSIVSFNIQNYAPKWRERAELIRQQIISNHPHFVALQEVRWDETQSIDNRFHDSTLQLSDLVQQFFGAHFSSFAHQSAMSYQKQYYIYSPIPRNEEGLAWFSQYQVLHYEYLLLGRNLSNWNSHQRIVQRIDVQLPNTNKVITVLNTHLPLEDEIRVLNFEDIELYSNSIKAEYEHSLTKYQHLATILVGDLNQEHVTLPQWKDAWVTLHNDPKLDSGLTFSTDFKYRKRIDYCFVKSSVPCQVKSFTVIKEQVGTLAASDHSAIAVTLQFPTKD